jgi:hypothetical protein
MRRGWERGLPPPRSSVRSRVVVGLHLRRGEHVSVGDFVDGAGEVLLWACCGAVGDECVVRLVGDDDGGCESGGAVDVEDGAVGDAALECQDDVVPVAVGDVDAAVVLGVGAPVVGDDVTVVDEEAVGVPLECDGVVGAVGVGGLDPGLDAAVSDLQARGLPTSTQPDDPSNVADLVEGSLARAGPRT